MKLYATTTSERASKGQGGKKLDIEIRNERRRLLGVVNIIPWGKESARVELHFAPDVAVRYEPKGKKQKGDIAVDGDIVTLPDDSKARVM